MKEHIKMLREQILVHACVIEILQDRVVSKTQWDYWSSELLRLQEKYPENVNIDYFDDIFRSWDGEQVMQLPLRDEAILAKARFLVDHKDLTPTFF